MKNYTKTTWVDNVTPINASNLNKIEKGISDIASSALTASDFEEGDGIEISTTDSGKVRISAIEKTEDKFQSSSLTGLEVVSEAPEDFQKGVLYLVISEETKKLSALYLNGECVCVWKVVVTFT